MCAVLNPYGAAYAELLACTVAHAEASHAYDLAIGLECDPVIRRFLLRRQAQMGDSIIRG
jgi:RNA polymerase sigma-70 factor (ECF subfamily)